VKDAINAQFGAAHLIIDDVTTDAPTTVVFGFNGTDIRAEAKQLEGCVEAPRVIVCLHDPPPGSAKVPDFEQVGLSQPSDP
jgi:hypothetical protein